MIPPIVHQVWLGPDPLPDEFAAYQESWLVHNPGWTLELWTEEYLPKDLRRPEVHDRLRIPAERADILRLEVLARFGGVYVDTDFECRQALEPHLEGVDFFTAYLKPGRVNNAIIGSVAAHPILERALAELQPRSVYGYDKAAAGPLFLDRLIKDYPEVRIFAPEVFYPSTPAEREVAVAIHHAARSWKDDEGFVAAAARARDRVALVAAEIDQARARQARLATSIERLREAEALARQGRRPGLMRRAGYLWHDAPLVVRERFRIPGANWAANGVHRARRVLDPARTRARRELLGLRLRGNRAGDRRPRVVPRVLHQIWLGPEPMPGKMAELRRGWLSHHAGWQHRLWTEDNLPGGLERSEIRELLRSPAERSQLLRLEVLHRYGGVHVESDLECRGPLDGVAADAELFLASFADGVPDESLIGAIPGHPAVELALRQLRTIEFWGQRSEGIGRVLVAQGSSTRAGAELLGPELVVSAGTAPAATTVAVRTSRREHERRDPRQETLVAERALSGLQRTLEAERARTAALETQLAGAQERLAALGR